MDLDAHGERRTDDFNRTNLRLDDVRSDMGMVWTKLLVLLGNDKSEARKRKYPEPWNRNAMTLLISLNVFDKELEIGT
jgi:hypothetical protein